MNRKAGAVLVLVATFILGGLAGAVLHFIYRNQAPPTPAGQVQPARPPGDLVQDMAAALGLDDSQKRELKRIFEQSREGYRTLSLQFRPQYDALRKETDDQIRRILRKDQVTLYDRLLKEGRERHKSPGPNIGPRGNGMRPPTEPLPPRNRN